MKLWMKILLGVALALIVALVFAGNYFYNYAVVPSEKDFLDEDTPGTTLHPKKRMHINGLVQKKTEAIGPSLQKTV